MSLSMRHKTINMVLMFLCKALTKLDQLEVQLTTTKLSASSLQLIQIHSQVSKSLDEITSAPLQEGYSLLETVCRGSPGIEVNIVNCLKMNFHVTFSTLCMSAYMYYMLQLKASAQLV